MPKISSLPSTSVVNLTDILPLVSPAVGGTTKKATFEKVLDAFVASNAFLSSNLGSGDILVGNASNVATPVSMSGDATLSNVGALTLANTSVTAGSYTINGKSLFTVDGKGRLTDAANAIIAGTDIVGEALTKVDDTNVTLTLGGSASTALLRTASITAGWTGTLSVSRGGTGTGTAFTAGSVVFSGASGVFLQDNSNFFWDDINSRFGISTNSSLTTSVNINGKISLFDGGTRNFNTGITTETNGAFIDIGTNDGSSNIFGGSYNPGNQGGYFRVAASGIALHSWYVRRAGLSGLPTLSAYITADANFGLSSGALSTTATNGFPYIPTCNGTPTGIPTSLNGLAPIVWDSSNHQLYVYGSTWEKTITSGEALTKTDDANVTITLGGSPSTALVNAASLTMGWSGQLSLSRGGTNASLTASDGGVVYSSASALQILPTSGGLNNILLTSISGAPHWTLSSFPDSCAVGNMLICNATNVWSVLAPTNNAILTSGATGIPTWVTTLPVSKGGTGTATAFTAGSVVFAGAAGVYSQKNSSLFWDNTNNRLGIGIATPTVSLEVNGILNIRNSLKNYPAGIATELSTDMIDFGINDSRFGTQVTANQGAFLRFDARPGNTLISFFTRAAGAASISTGPFLNAGPGGRTNFALSSTSLFTTDSDGFPYLPTMGGTPTGVPTSFSGLVPVVYDTSANRLWIYNGAWRSAVFL